MGVIRHYWALQGEVMVLNYTPAHKVSVLFLSLMEPPLILGDACVLDTLKEKRSTIGLVCLNLPLSVGEMLDLSPDDHLSRHPFGLYFSTAWSNGWLAEVPTCFLSSQLAIGHLHQVKNSFDSAFDCRRCLLIPVSL